MSAGSSIVSVTADLTLVAAFDDILRCNNVLHDGTALTEECFLRFVRQQEWCRQQWQLSILESLRLKRELDATLSSVSSLEQKFIHARKLLDAEKRHRRIAEEERLALEKQMALARDLLFNDNRNKLNDETLEKLQFLNNNTMRSCHGDYQNNNLLTANPRLNAIPELNSTGTLLSDQSFSRSEDDLDVSMATGRRSWRRPGHVAPASEGKTNTTTSTESVPAKKRRSSGSHIVTTSAWNNGDGGLMLATATTTLTLKHSDNLFASPAKRDPSSPLPPQASSTSSKASLPTAPPPQPDSSSDYCSDSGIVHNWASKTVIRPEPCVACKKRIMFAKAALRCNTCRSLVHSHCKESVPVNCTPRSPHPGLSGIGSPRLPQVITTPTATKMHLSSQVPATPPYIPPLIVHCVNEIESRGLDEVGLYRIPGSEREVRELKQRVLGGDLSPVRTADVHTLCSCLKDFLRGLEELLIPKHSRPHMILASTSGNTSALKRSFVDLPEANRHTLAFILEHLKRVGTRDACRMPLKNLAMIFGPTLVGYDSDSADILPVDAYNQSRAQVILMEALLALPSDWLSEQIGRRSHRRESPELTSDCGSTSDREKTPPLHGFFYSPIASSHSRSRRQHKFYAP